MNAWRFHSKHEETDPGEVGSSNAVELGTGALCYFSKRRMLPVRASMPLSAT
jgi:hypothetical protein